MLIQIIRTDSRFDYVKGIILDKLLEAGEVARFRRSSGWVSVGVDPIRRSKRDYTFQTPAELIRRAA